MRRSFESIENISEIKEDFNKLNEGQKDKVEINGQTVITKDEYKKLKKNGIILNNNNPISTFPKHYTKIYLMKKLLII